MKFILKVVLLILLTSNAAYANKKIIEKIDALECKLYLSMTNADTQTFSKYLHPNLLYIHSNGKIDSKTSLIQSIASKELQYIKIEILKKNFRVFRNTIIVNGEAIYKIVYKGTPMELNFVYSNVYIKGIILKNGW